MPLRTISSPGVQLSEVDLSTRAAVGGGTTVLIPGYATQGPVDEVFAVGGMGELESVYGKPTNAAERYFYQTARACFNSNARVLSTRVPYGSGTGLGLSDDYTALFYPVFPYRGADSANVYAEDASVTMGVSGGTDQLGASLSAAGNDTVFLFGRPQMVRLTRTQYQDLEQGNYTWSDRVKLNQTFDNTTTTWGKAGMIVTNIARTTVNDKYEGFYLAMTDNTQMNPATNFSSILTHYSVNENSTDLNLEVPKSRRNFPLSGTPLSNDDSVSELLETIPSFDISTTEFDDTVLVGLFKLRTSIFSTDVLKLDYVLAESYMGSLDAQRKLQNPGGGNPQTFFLADVEDGSPNIEILVNKHISFTTGTWMGSATNVPQKKVRFLSDQLYNDSSVVELSGNGGIPPYVMGDIVRQCFPGTDGASVGVQTADQNGAIGVGPLSGNGCDSLFPLGSYQVSNPQNKQIGNLPDKLDRIFRTIENVDITNIDISVEAGLGTIYSGAKWNKAHGPEITRGDTFDDEITVDIGTIDHDNDKNTTGVFQIRDDVELGTQPKLIVDNWKVVHNVFNDFAEFNRKDHLHIADCPRWLMVQGINQKVMDDKRRTFTQAVYWPMRHVFGAASSSYSCTFGNWGRVYNGTTDRLMWAPFSGMAAATMANNDAAFGPWYAPAGFTRGRFGGVVDIAVIPSQKHRDQLYKINVNPVTQFPGEGFVIFGQKTFFKKPSAFDRLNVRRLFLHLEKIVRQSMKYYVFEPNTLLTRTSVLNNLTPIFENIRINQGLYDYLIICDERNNNTNTIDANELVVDIYIKPVRAAEIILVNFYATRTGQDFSEIIS